MVQVHVGGSQHRSLIAVLRFDQLFRQFGLVMVVNQCQCRHYSLVGYNVLFHEMIPHEIPDSLRTVAVSFLFYHSVESLEKVLLHRDAGTY